jgi:hypothetical protein
MSISGSFTLLIRSDRLNLDDITNNIGLKPTGSKSKGESISKALNQNMRDNLWQYQVKYDESDNPNNVLDEFLSLLTTKSKFIQKASKEYEVHLTWFLQSDYAQMGVVLKPDVLKKLADLKLQFELHILSWGGVKD